ncbi:MAG: endolytic transglycosylase MltG [bacterium]
MFKEKGLFRRILPDLIFDIGFCLILIAIFIMNPRMLPNYSVNQYNEKKQAVYLDDKGLSLNYSKLTQEDKIIEVKIPKGASAIQVANLLSENKIISHEDFFLLMNMFNIEKKIKAGKYYFNNNSSVSEVLNKILIKQKGE